MTEIKRLNYFTGFFMTARDFQDEQTYHLEKRRLLNRGLHTPGILRGIGGDLDVVPANGWNIRVLAGAALLANGDEVVLGEPRLLPVAPSPTRRVYIVLAEREDQATDYVENVEAKQYSGYTRLTEVPKLAVLEQVPAGGLELARIDVAENGTASFSLPVDPAQPGPNEIDRRFVVWAGAAGVQPAPAADAERLAGSMTETRRAFAALTIRFPVPSADDTRHSALTLEIMARGGLASHQVPAALTPLAYAEQDVGQEVAVSYPATTAQSEYLNYVEAVARLQSALRQNVSLSNLLNAQDEVARCARELAEMVLLLPIAQTGADLVVTASGSEASVILDGSASHALGGRQLIKYRWHQVGGG